MSTKEQGFISIFDDNGWYSETFTNPEPLWIDSESLSLNKEIKSLDNLTRSGRAQLPQSQISGEVKPSGEISYQPRPSDLHRVLYSHFHYGTNFGGGTAPGTAQYFPADTAPTYADIPWGNGSYGGTQAGVYSVSFLKKYFDTTDNNGTNAIFYKHGICDSLEFTVDVDKDLVVNASYKFKDYVRGTTVPENPSDPSVGTYNTETPWQWYQGTITLNGASIGLETLSVKSSNNLVEKSRVGRLNPQEFPFRDYTCEGEFSLDFPTDGLAEIGSMLDLSEFSLSGTFLNGTNFLSIDMPRCIRMPYDVNLGKRVTSNIPFVAFGTTGTSPITVNLRGDMGYVDWFYDAGTTASSRTLGDYTLLDAANGARTLGEYTLYDRDL